MATIITIINQGFINLRFTRQPPANDTPAPSCIDVVIVCTILIGLGFGLSSLIMHFSHSHHPQPLPPIIILSSITATTLSNTTPATWNLSLSVSNPNPKYNIYYNHFFVGLYYNNHSNSSNIVSVGVDELDKFVQPVQGYGLLSSSVTFSTRNLGEKDVVERFLEDQNKGSVGVTIKASYSMNFKKEDDVWDMENIFCGGVIVYFEKSSGNKTGLGSASELPREFQFYNP